MALKKKTLRKMAIFLLQIEKLKRQQICELPQKQFKLVSRKYRKTLEFFFSYSFESGG